MRRKKIEIDSEERLDRNDLRMVINFISNSGYDIPFADESIIYDRFVEKLDVLEYLDTSTEWESVLEEYEEEIINPQHSIKKYEDYN